MSTIEKLPITTVFIGHVDAGKSTTAGHLLYQCGAVDDHTITENHNRSIQFGHAHLDYAFVFDKLQAERDRGITIDIGFMKFETNQAIYTIIDAPGHRDFIKNMITGTSLADVGVLVVDASVGCFERGVSAGGQTREHALLAFVLGVREMIVCVNKMDLVGYSERRFNEIRETVEIMLERIGFKSVSFVPICGWLGDNLVERSGKMNWFRGSTLFDLLDAVVPPKRLSDKPLRIPVRSVYHIKGVGTVSVGRIEFGTLKTGMEVIFAPSGMTSEVKSIEVYNQPIQEAKSGDSVGFNTPDSSDIKKGYICGDLSNDPPKEVSDFIAHITIINHPGEIHPGYTPILHCHTSHTACRFHKLIARIDKKTREKIEENPPFIKQGMSALVKIVPTKRMCVESYNHYPQLGRFAVRDMNETVAIGVIKSVTPR
eukprot:TRINITY_DN6801_c0_g1_i1.p1 TRINITY_DN6801_c0_g1~~TRINITY_DN6801_c0_g1_i1.p1  ORF type:complete len:439 (+),score=54.68 TRINITY_DN6801_c0_g1_i1:35-1318(+)